MPILYRIGVVTKKLYLTGLRPRLDLYNETIQKIPTQWDGKPKTMNSPSQNWTNKLSQESKAARAEIEKALSFHFQGDKAEALKALRKALRKHALLSADRNLILPFIF